MTAAATHGALQRLAGPLRTWSGAGWLALGFGTAAVLLAGWAWAVRLGWLAAPYWVFLAWIMALAALAVVAWLAWKAHVRLSTGRVARQLEELGGWRGRRMPGCRPVGSHAGWRSWVTGVAAR